MSFKASNCMKFAVELVGGITIIFLCGLFGWSATPAAFQVITRAILFQLKGLLLGLALMYVDDIIGVSAREHISTDLDAARGVCTGLLGDNAVQDEKTVTTDKDNRRMDVIGYTLDLGKQVVTLSHRNYLKTLYLFFSVDTAAPVPVKSMERIASLASRYSGICREMKPFTKALYSSYAGLRNKSTSVRLKDDAVRWTRTASHAHSILSARRVLQR